MFTNPPLLVYADGYTPDFVFSILEEWQGYTIEKPAPEMYLKGTCGVAIEGQLLTGSKVSHIKLVQF